MHRLVIVIVIALAACANKPAARSGVGVQAPIYQVSCDYGYSVLPLYRAPSLQSDAPIVHAHDAARAHHDTGTAAIEAKHPDVAAAEFMACARAYAAITDDDSERGLAQKTAELCIGDATYAYATAGKFAAVGRAELEKLAAEDARLKPAIDARLAKPPSDCADTGK